MRYLLQRKKGFEVKMENVSKQKTIKIILNNQKE